MVEGLAACFAGLADPRQTSRCDHRLVDILAIAVCAVVACAESWEDIELYGRSKRAWLETFLALPNGIPSYQRAYELTFLIHGWSQRERRRPGSATSRFQAVQQASTMAR